MSKLPKIQLERLPKRDALVRLRAAYACLEQGEHNCQQTADRQPSAKTKQEEAS